MPRINLNDGPQLLRCFDVVGEYSQAGSEFVQHVGLSSTDNQLVEAGEDVSATHMSPPFEAAKMLPVHVAGHVPLTTSEIRQIEAWIEEVAEEYTTARVGTGRQYIVHPPWRDVKDPHTGVRRYRRYSCAGFVLDSHRRVNINLLEVDNDGLITGDFPDIDENTIQSIYPQARSNSNILALFGLDGTGPWKVVLPGYVVHALDRPTEKIRREPYQAKPGDERF